MATPSYSLRRRLVVLLLAAIAATWTAIIVYSYIDIRHESEELLDAHLAQSAALILAQAEHGLEEIEVEHASQFRESARVAFQLWERGRTLRLHSSHAPNTLFSAKTTGFSDVIVDGREWRVFSAWTRHHEHLVQVAERSASRREITDAMIGNLLLPLLIALPLLGFLAWLVVAHALKPLARLGREVAARAAVNLAPLGPQEAPLEIRPLIDNLNNLFSRVSRLIEHERRFNADAAHELRTPLAALMTQAQVARAATGDAERNRALENVVAGCVRAARLVDQMLTLARLEPDDAIGRCGIFDLHALARQVIAEIAPLALERSLDLQLAESGEIMVPGNSDLIGIALRNLTDNALRYSPDGGHVEIRAALDNGSALISVIDRGPGLSAEERGKVGQRFYRVLGSGATGSGLGLSIVHRIAALHGGSLTLDAAEGGHGLKADLRWPARQTKPASPPG